MNPSTTASAGPAARSAAPWVSALLAWLATFVVVAAGVAACQSYRPEAESAPPLARNGRSLVPNNTNASVQGEQVLVLNRPGAPRTLLAVRTGPIEAKHYARAVLDAAPVAGASLALVWVRRDEPGRPFEQRFAADGSRHVAPGLDRLPDWRGEIVFLGIAVEGTTRQPVTIAAFELQPASVAAAVRDMLGDWFAPEPWDGRSINVVHGGRDEQRAWLPPLVFVASLVSAIAFAIVARRRKQRFSSLALLVPFVAGWLLLDLRWQRSLAEQARSTWSQFAGRTWEQRHLAMEDGELFRFVRTAEARLPDRPVRIFATSDFEYFRRRAGFHLYPHNVLAYDWADPAILRAGDYVLFYQKNDVHYDPATRELVWKSGPRVPANVVVAQRGAGLFEVRNP